jgi:nicotinamide riboside kinase
MKIAFVGAPSSGKTTLINGISSILKENFHETLVVKDHAREFVNNNANKDFTLSEQYQLSRMSIAIEGVNMNTKAIVLSDFSTIITAYYTIRHGAGTFSLYDFAKVKGQAITDLIMALEYYDLVIFCDIMKDPVEEPGRQFNKSQMLHIHKEMLGFFYLLGITKLDKFIRLSHDNYDNRVKTVLDEMKKRMVLTLWNQPQVEI